MKKMVRVLMITVLSICSFFLLSQPLCWAQDNPLTRMEIPSSPNPVGSGARALGMGGAFIAVADDATAASWNPGGLIQLEKPEVSVVGGYIYRTEDNTFGTNPEASGSESVEDFNLNYLSAAYPFQAFGRNMIVSLNYQHLYDFNRDWGFKIHNSNPIYSGPIDYDFEQDGALYALGLAYAVEITPDISVGATLNYWGDFILDNDWSQKFRWEADIELGGQSWTSLLEKTEEFEFDGWNGNLGFLWRITGNLTLGGVFKTPFTADIDHTIKTKSSHIFPGESDPAHSSSTSLRFKEELKMPMSYGLGLSYRFSDDFSISGDLYRTHWNDFEYRDADGNKTSPISGVDIRDSDIDPTTWFRVGAEYRIIREKFAVPIRAGVFYDPAPAEGSADDYYGFSLGSGFAYKGFIFDIAYQFRYGDDVGGSMLEEMDLAQDVREHIVYSSLIVHF